MRCLAGGAVLRVGFDEPYTHEIWAITINVLECSADRQCLRLSPSLANRIQNCHSQSMVQVLLIFLAAHWSNLLGNSTGQRTTNPECWTGISPPREAVRAIKLHQCKDRWSDTI